MSRQPQIFKRRAPARLGPNRGAGGFYRTSEKKGRQAGGVPLNSPNDAVVAAVRMAYKVAEAQVDRSTRLARRLRDAGDRAVGSGSDRKAVDAAERLVMKTVMSALEWWETSVAQGRCPVKRLAAAEYRMMGNMLGLDTTSGRAKEGRKDREDEREGSEARPPGRRLPRLAIYHEGEPRAVRVLAWELDGARNLDKAIVFYHERGKGKFRATFSIEDKRPSLTLKIPVGVESGSWKAAICSSTHEQLGFVEILL